MKNFYEFISEEILSTVRSRLDKYKSRSLSNKFKISHTSPSSVRFTYKKDVKPNNVYHIHHVKAALSGSSLYPKSHEEHEDGFTLHFPNKIK